MTDSYIGVPPQSGFITTAKQRVTSSTNNYVDLDHSISSLADVIVWVNFVKQDSTNLTLTTSTRITLGATLVASDIVEIAYLGKAVATQTPDTGTVTLDMLSASGTKSSSTFLAGDNTFKTAGGDADNYFATSGLSSKDLGVGLHVKSADSSASVDSSADELVIEGSGASGMTLLSGTSSSGSIYFGDSGDNDIGYVAYNHSSNALMFGANANEGLRVTGDGAVSIGTTETAYSNLTQADDNGIILTDGSASIFATNTDVPLVVARSNGDSAARDCVIFSRGGVTCGTITATPSATSYNTSSDYRLKENVDYDFDATTRLKQLKPARFNFIVDETNTLVDGFLAHEVSSIVPEAIIGEKDGIEKNEDGTNKLDNDGNTIPKYQGIDQAKLVPLLVKTIQELEVRIKTLEDA